MQKKKEAIYSLHQQETSLINSYYVLLIIQTLLN